LRLLREPVTPTRCGVWALTASCVWAIAGAANRAPLAIAHETAKGIDFNLNVMYFSFSNLSKWFLTITTCRTALTRGGGQAAPPPRALPLPAKAFGLVRLNYCGLSH
jgi:hypothetical protein